VNLVSRGDEEGLAWFSGPTLLESLGTGGFCSCSYIESIDAPKRPLDLPLRLSITDIFKTSRNNVVTVTGRVESGILQLGDDIITEPGENKGTVRCKISISA
jgi:translation elongation factor EF-1alpha